MALSERQKQILQAVYELHGEATLRQISDRTGLSLNGLSQTVGGRSEWLHRFAEIEHVRPSEDTRVRLTVSDDTLRRLKVVSDPLRRPAEPTLDYRIRQRAEEVWRDNHAGLNYAGAHYLQRCLCWIYGGLVLSDTHHPPTKKLRDGDARLIENRARQLAADYPYEEGSDEAG